MKNLWKVYAVAIVLAIVSKVVIVGFDLDRDAAYIIGVVSTAVSMEIVSRMNL